MHANPLVVLIANQPGMADRLIRLHSDDGRGRCAVCSDGAQRARYAWPCTIHGTAVIARESAGRDQWTPPGLDVRR